MSSPRPILILAFPRAQLLDVSGPLQVFASVNELALERGQPAPYAPRIVAADAGPVETSSASRWSPTRCARPRAASIR